jgi:hypothetical protein
MTALIAYNYRRGSGEIDPEKVEHEKILSHSKSMQRDCQLSMFKAFWSKILTPSQLALVAFYIILRGPPTFPNRNPSRSTMEGSALVDNFLRQISRLLRSTSTLNSEAQVLIPPGEGHLGSTRRDLILETYEQHSTQPRTTERTN